MEQIISEATSKHIKDKKVIGSSQHGFVKTKSYLTNMRGTCDEMTSLVDKQRAVYGGFSTGFDTVSSSILTDKSDGVQTRCTN